jgi:hypothetical protein
MKFPIDGNLIIDLNLDGIGSGTISQTLSTTLGEFYALSFYLAGPDLSATNPVFPNPRQVSIEVSGVSQIFSTPASNHLDLEWQLHELIFQATGNQTNLTFSSLDRSGFWGPVLDNVTVVSNVVNITESVPGPLPVLGAAAAFGFSRKLRKRIKSSKLPVASAID